jgi:glycosyltransferase involved in cell wall biosynthesis
MRNRIWLTWETQRRNRTLAEAFGCKYARIDHCHRHALIRYPLSAFQTLRELIRGDYDIVFAQSPSIVLCAMLSALRRFWRFKLVLDVHNVIFEQARNSSVLGAIIRFGFRGADHVIVSNANLVDEARRNGGSPLVLPDPVPDIERREMPLRFADAGRPIITFICSFADDEPIGLFLEAIGQVDRAFTLLITGRRSKAGNLLKHESEQVRFVDFLSEEDFEGLIQHSDLLVDLTTRDNCLVCGAYEAVAVGTPALLSDLDVNRELFSGGCLYATNELKDYVRRVEEFLDNREHYRSEMLAFRQAFEKNWSRMFRQVDDVLQSAGGA